MLLLSNYYASGYQHQMGVGFSPPYNKRFKSLALAQIKI